MEHMAKRVIKEVFLDKKSLQTVPMNPMLAIAERIKPGMRSAGRVIFSPFLLVDSVLENQVDAIAKRLDSEPGN